MADALLEPARYHLSDAITDSGWGSDVAPAETALASQESRGRPLMLRDALEQVRGYDSCWSIVHPAWIGRSTRWISELIGAERGERSEDRATHRNG